MNFKQNKYKIIVCDECENEFVLKQKDIKTKDVIIDGVALKLVYFQCKKCKEIFKIFLHDDEYEKLRQNVERARIKLKQSENNFDDYVVNLNIFENHLEKLTNYVKSFSDKYTGKFKLINNEFVYVKENRE